MYFAKTTVRHGACPKEEYGVHERMQKYFRENYMSHGNVLAWSLPGGPSNQVQEKVDTELGYGNGTFFNESISRGMAYCLITCRRNILKEIKNTLIIPNNNILIAEDYKIPVLHIYKREWITKLPQAEFIKISKTHKHRKGVCVNEWFIRGRMYRPLPKWSIVGKSFGDTNFDIGNRIKQIEQYVGSKLIICPNINLGISKKSDDPGNDIRSHNALQIYNIIRRLETSEKISANKNMFNFKLDK